MEPSDNTLQDHLAVDLKDRKVYPLGAVLAGTVLGGPIVSGFMMANNYKAFKEQRKVLYTWVFSVVMAILSIGTALVMISLIGRQTIFIIPVVDLGIIYFLMRKLQAKPLITYVRDGGIAHNWWVGFFVGILGLASTYGLTYILAVIAFLIYGGVC